MSEKLKKHLTVIFLCLIIACLIPLLIPEKKPERTEVGETEISVGNKQNYKGGKIKFPDFIFDEASLEVKTTETVSDEIGYDVTTYVDNANVQYYDAGKVTDSKTIEPGQLTGVFIKHSAGTNGVPRWFFAYVGIPATNALGETVSASNPVPAVVCVHGGNGTAYSEWVTYWMKRGYAAIAMDTVGSVPLLTNESYGAIDSGPDYESEMSAALRVKLNMGIGNTLFTDVTESKEIEDQWMYQAVSSVITSTTYMRSLDVIDDSKIAITGISYGGYLSTLATAYDARYCASVSIYASLEQQEGDTHASAYIKNKPLAAELWDSNKPLYENKIPILFVTGNTDPLFSVLSSSKSVEEIPNAKMFLAHEFAHGHSVSIKVENSTEANAVYNFMHKYCYERQWEYPSVVIQPKAYKSQIPSEYAISSSKTGQYYFAGVMTANPQYVQIKSAKVFYTNNELLINNSFYPYYYATIPTDDPSKTGFSNMTDIARDNEEGYGDYYYQYRTIWYQSEVPVTTTTDSQGNTVFMAIVEDSSLSNSLDSSNYFYFNFIDNTGMTFDPDSLAQDQWGQTISTLVIDRYRRPDMYYRLVKDGGLEGFYNYEQDENGWATYINESGRVFQRILSNPTTYPIVIHDDFGSEANQYQDGVSSLVLNNNYVMNYTGYNVYQPIEFYYNVSEVGETMINGTASGKAWFTFAFFDDVQKAFLASTYNHETSGQYRELGVIENNLLNVDPTLASNQLVAPKFVCVSSSANTPIGSDDFSGAYKKMLVNHTEFGDTTEDISKASERFDYVDGFVKVTIRILEDKTIVCFNDIVAAEIDTINRSSFKGGKAYMTLASHNNEEGAVQLNLKKGTTDYDELADPIYKNTITFVNDDITLQTTRVVQGEKVETIGDLQKDGYSFLGWYLGEDRYNFDAPVFDDLTLTAKWEVIDYSITYEALDEASIDGENPVSYNIESSDFTLINPTKEGYTFVGWTGTDLQEASKTVVIPQGSIGNRSYTANWKINSYTITFKNYDGTLISSEVYDYKETVVVPADPEKQADNTYRYVFAGWDNDVEIVKGDKTYTATYQEVYIDYTITFKNFDGSVIDSKTYHYGEEVEVPADPTRPADETYTYTFNGWNELVSTVTSDKEYTAQYTPEYIDYVIKFVNDDGTEISSETYHYGEEVEVPADPTKLADETYTYTFKGWDSQISTVKGNKTYTATYTSTYINYVVVFKNYNGVELSTKNYHYGDKVNVPENPTKPADETYTYVFKGWDSEVVDCDGDKTYTAEFTPVYIEYIIIFEDYDGRVLSENTYHYGATVEIPTSPTREADKTYTYAFKGWNEDVTTVNGDKTYIATYTETYINYIVIFKNFDNTEISKKTTYHYGDEVEVPADPARPADETYTYTFKGWDSQISTVSGDKTYTATYTETYINYTVTFNNYDGSEISSKTYHYGDKIVVPTTPTKPADETYTYVFKGWDSEIVDCDGNKTYTAEFTPVYIEYKIIFKDYDGRAISENTYHYGATVEIPTSPTREADKTYTYAFNGWDAEISTVSEDKTYTATYTEIYINYTVTFNNYDGSEISSKTYHYGDKIEVPTTPTKPADETYTYEFKGWGSEVVNCDGDKTYTAEFTPVFIEYEIVFKDYDGRVISSKKYHYGDEVEVPADPIRQADNTYAYTFKGWNTQISTVREDKTYTATYKETYINYTVTFKNYDGSEISSKTYHYGQEVEVPADPTRPADNTYTYTFKGWDSQISTVSANKVYTATYTGTYINYTVTFKNYDGSEISSKTYHYGDKIVVPAAPTKPADETYTYEFKGWGCDVVNCDGDKTYTAEFMPVFIEYVITFKDYDGRVISTKKYHYNDEVEEPAYPTRKADKTYTYDFYGWDDLIVSVSENKTYTAVYSQTHINYTVVFKNYDGTLISSKVYHYGDKIEVPVDPTRPADEKYTYTFKGWDSEVVDCDGDKTYVAQFTTNSTGEDKDDNSLIIIIIAIAAGSCVIIGISTTAILVTKKKKRKKRAK